MKDGILNPIVGIQYLKKIGTLFEIDPKEFLEYAYQDFELDDIRGFINALSNVKRAIESQSDIIHFSFGIPYQNLNFPIKMENIQKMGISPSVILKHINKIRVDLEHFYKIPDREKIEDAIQIAQLFLDLTTLALTNFWGYFSILNEDEEIERVEGMGRNRIYVRYDDVNKKFELELTKNGEIETIEISANDGNDYIKLINLSIEIGKHMHNFDENAESRLYKKFYSKLD